ncbi:hypothetical protein J5N97_007229 [Dioscorea zingiberensis]|uniref:Signal peptidase complex subunit 1 n=1 Tax=Dioscorea zingiberensis TaxID=325984 RepID=A0A9D5DBE0_9LILI|nr:hypothetical protein J5N97_007229 [Dioscorea zingiberensis]
MYITPPRSKEGEREVHSIPKNAKMDWQGQRRAEMLMQVMLVVFGVVALVVGYSMGSFRTMMLIYAGGVTLTALITVPNWPCFNRHPLTWLEPTLQPHPPPLPINHPDCTSLLSLFLTSSLLKRHFPQIIKIETWRLVGAKFVEFYGLAW